MVNISTGSPGVSISIGSLGVNISIGSLGVNVSIGSLGVNPYSPDCCPVYRTWFASTRDK